MQLAEERHQTAYVQFQDAAESAHESQMAGVRQQAQHAATQAASRYNSRIAQLEQALELKEKERLHAAETQRRERERMGNSARN